MNNFHFTHYKNRYFAIHFQGFDLSYKSPSASTLISLLLDQRYKKLKAKVDSCLYAACFFRFYTDESNYI